MSEKKAPNAAMNLVIALIVMASVLPNTLYNFFQANLSGTSAFNSSATGVAISAMFLAIPVIGLVGLLFKMYKDAL